MLRGLDDGSALVLVLSAVIAAAAWKYTRPCASAATRTATAQSSVGICDLQHRMGTPFVLCVGIVYFAQGFKSLAGLSMQLFLKDSLQLQPADSQALVAMAMLPWSFKPIYGLASDYLPIMGRKRKPYVFIAGLVGLLGWLTLWYSAQLQADAISRSVVVAAYFATSLSSAIADVVVDGWVAEKSKQDETVETVLQNFSWSCMALGGMLGSLIGATGLAHLGVHGIFLLTASCPCLVTVAAITIKEERGGDLDNGRSLRGEISRLIQCVRSPMVWSPMLYVFLSNAIPPSLNQPLYYFVSDELGISNEFLSSAETVMWGMMLLGSAIAPYVLNEKTSYSSSFFWGSFALMLCTLNTLALVTRANVRVGLPDRLFMLGSDSVETLISRIMMLPFLTLAAKLTPEGMEATCFALFMSVNNFGYQVAGFSGSYLTAYLEIGNGNFGNLWIAVLVRAVLMLIPMALVHRMVPKTVQRAATKDAGFDKSA